MDGCRSAGENILGCNPRGGGGMEDPVGIGILRLPFPWRLAHWRAFNPAGLHPFHISIPPSSPRLFISSRRPAATCTTSAGEEGKKQEITLSPDLLLHVSAVVAEKLFGTGPGLMGVKGDRASPGVLDGLYGVQLGRRPSPGDGGDGEAVRTAVVEYSAASDSEPQFRDGETLQRLPIRRLWQHRPSFLKPVHCTISCGDRHAGETIANVITSVPFIILGMQTPRTTLNTALYANSLVGVGVASSLYHSSKGEIRKFLRWADYTMIATTTLCLSRALRNENPRLLMAASALLLPFQPLMVSVVHTGMMEVSFAKRASIEPELRMAHNLHKMSSLLGGALFIADDCFPETPYIHAAWHLAAAIGIGTCNKLLQ